MPTIQVFILLLLKHTFADLFLQSTRPPTNKSTILSWGLHRHCIDHAVLTLIILLFFVSVQLAFLLAILDYISHCLIDFTKHKVMKYYEIPKQGKRFWALQTADQALHYITYFIIVLLIGGNI